MPTAKRFETPAEFIDYVETKTDGYIEELLARKFDDEVYYEICDLPSEFDAEVGFSILELDAYARRRFTISLEAWQERMLESEVPPGLSDPIDDGTGSLDKGRWVGCEATHDARKIELVAGYHETSYEDEGDLRGTNPYGDEGYGHFDTVGELIYPEDASRLAGKVYQVLELCEEKTRRDAARRARRKGNL